MCSNLTNNDVLWSIRYAFDLSDSKMIALFSLGNLDVSRDQVCDWLKEEDDPAYQNCTDIQLAMFLNGLINDRRGKKEGAQPEPEMQLTNNIILRKMKIALDLRADDVLGILGLAKYRISKNELSALFRKTDNKHYRVCKDQLLRNFLNGVQLKYRDNI